MKRSIITLGFITSLLAGNAFACGGYPDYPTHQHGKRTYHRQMHWLHDSQPETPSIQSPIHCSDYPKAAEYRRADRRMGMNKKCESSD